MKDKELAALGNFFKTIAGEGDSLDMRSFTQNPKNSFILGKAISQILAGDNISNTMKPYVAQVQGNKLLIFSFYGFVKLGIQNLYTIGRDAYKVADVKESGVKSVKVKTDKGTFSLGLYLTTYSCEKAGGVIKTRESILLDAMNGSDLKDLTFEITDYWARKNGLNLDFKDFLTNQSNEKLFYKWFNSLKEEKKEVFYSKEAEAVFSDFLKGNNRAKTAA